LAVADFRTVLSRAVEVIQAIVKHHTRATFTTALHTTLGPVTGLHTTIPRLLACIITTILTVSSRGKRAAVRTVGCTGFRRSTRVVNLFAVPTAAGTVKVHGGVTIVLALFEVALRGDHDLHECGFGLELFPESLEVGFGCGCGFGRSIILGDDSRFGCGTSIRGRSA